MGFFRRIFGRSSSKSSLHAAQEQSKPHPKKPSPPSSQRAPNSPSPVSKPPRCEKSRGSPKSVKAKTVEEEPKNDHGFTTPVGYRPKPDNMTVAENLVYDWLMAFQNHDMAKLEELTDNSSVFVFEEANGDRLEFRCRDILAVAGNFWEGFPDCAYGWDSIRENEESSSSSDDKGSQTTSVTLANWRWFGHHTGVPYIHEPFPPIPAEGKYILDGPLMMTFRIGKNVGSSSGKLHIKRTEAKGRNMGPHGTYEKLGGILF